MSVTQRESIKTVGIVGPTAVGKTAVGVQLAALLDGAAEIVSVDSVQVYRGLDIGAAKPTVEERNAAAFSMIDVVDPDADYTLADYQREATAELSRIARQQRIALLVGGTGLYFRSITTRLDIPHTPPDPAFRMRWQETARLKGASAVREHLLSIDPDATRTIHANDIRRMIRAIEVYEKTGKPLSQWHRENAQAEQTPVPGRWLFCLGRDRQQLYEAIERRVDAMMAQGLVDEVAGLRERGYGSELKSMQSLGYRRVNEYLDGKISLKDAIDLTKNETKQYARRQLIWFRADKRLTWIDTDGLSAAQIAARIFASVNNKQSTNQWEDSSYESTPG